MLTYRNCTVTVKLEDTFFHKARLLDCLPEKSMVTEFTGKRNRFPALALYLERLAPEEFGCFLNRPPKSLRGMKLKARNSAVCFMVFQSGTVNIIGPRSHKEIAAAWHAFHTTMGCSHRKVKSVNVSNWVASIDLTRTEMCVKEQKMMDMGCTRRLPGPRDNYRARIYKDEGGVSVTCFSNGKMILRADTQTKLDDFVKKLKR